MNYVFTALMLACCAYAFIGGRRARADRRGDLS